MLRRMNKLRGFKIRATDGDIGQIDDFYFDDTNWRVRYLVADTGSWLFGRKVLLSPFVAQSVLWEEEVVPVSLNKDQIEHSPEIDLDLPVSRQHELALHTHYGWPAYWASGAMIGATAPMNPVVEPVTGVPPQTEQPHAVGDSPSTQAEVSAANRGDPHLFSVKDVKDYHIQATDGSIGHLVDFFVSETEWDIRYALVDTRNWLPGRRVLILPEHIRNISWEDSKLVVDLTKDEVKGSPEFDPEGSLDRSYETTYFDYYDRPYYWV